MKLNNVRQGQQSIEKYSDYVEELFKKLTISQAKESNIDVKELVKLHSKSTIERYIAGLTDNNIATILRARDHEKLGDEIASAKTQELLQTQTACRSQVFHYNGRNYNNTVTHHRGRPNYNWNAPCQQTRSPTNETYYRRSGISNTRRDSHRYNNQNTQGGRGITRGRGARGGHCRNFHMHDEQVQSTTRTEAERLNDEVGQENRFFRGETTEGKGAVHQGDQLHSN